MTTLTPARCRDLKLFTPSRNVDFHVTTKDFLLLTSSRSRHQKGCRDTNSSSLGRDAKAMSRPRPVWSRLCARCPGHGSALALSCVLLRARPPLPYAPAAFLSRPQHDPVLEIGSSHSSFCLAQKFFFFFSKPPVAFLLLLGCSSLTHCYLPTQNL